MVSEAPEKGKRTPAKISEAPERANPARNGLRELPKAQTRKKVLTGNSKPFKQH